MRKRPLREDERRLWQQVARTVTPLGGATSAGAIEAAHDEPAPAAPAAEPSGPVPDGQKAVRPRPPRPPGDLDRKTRRKVARGVVAIDARLDLHGMTQDEAQAALVRFIDASVVKRRRVVLVITGKGRGGEGRGILRRAVPMWLAARELRRVVVSFGPAHHSHGGDGALYVHLRSGGGAG